jgi:hypothetical protein
MGDGMTEEKSADKPQEPKKFSILDYVVTTTPEVKVDRVDFETLRVRRIDVVDPDGVIRMTLAGSLPNPVVDGVEYRRSTPVGGIMMRDDKGNERGGFGYASRPQAVVFALDHPTGEAVGFNVLSDGSTRMLMLTSPVDTRDPAVGDHLLPGGSQKNPVDITMAPDGTPRFNLKDKDGHTRMRMTVTSEGYGSIEFLDKDGNVVSQMTPELNIAAGQVSRAPLEAAELDPYRAALLTKQEEAIQTWVAQRVKEAHLPTACAEKNLSEAEKKALGLSVDQVLQDGSGNIPELFFTVARPDTSLTPEEKDMWLKAREAEAIRIRKLTGDAIDREINEKCHEMPAPAGAGIPAKERAPGGRP